MLHLGHPSRVKIEGIKIVNFQLSIIFAGVVELGSDASAAGGGSSELSAWQRSARDEGGNAKDIRRAPQQEGTLDLGAVTS